jgi:hypothetical protein
MKDRSLEQAPPDSSRAAQNHHHRGEITEEQVPEAQQKTHQQII